MIHPLLYVAAAALFACANSTGSTTSSGSSGNTQSRVDAGPPCNVTGCDSSTFCDVASGQCVPGCGSDDACGENASCDLQTHRCGCKSGFHVCNDFCVSTDSTSSCGQSCTPCPEQPNATASCDGTSCQYACVAGSKSCDGACAACPTGGATQTTCSGAACVATSCQSGYLLCGGVCSPCPSDGVTGTECEGNRCVATGCDTGYVSCSGGCVACRPTDQFCCVETVDRDTGNLGAGRFASVAAADGTVAIAYRDDTAKSARVASRPDDGGTWGIETVSGPGDQGEGASGAVGSDGTLYAVWYDADALTYQFGRKPPGGSWTVEPVDTINSILTSGKASLRLSSAGVPCVAYENGDTLWYTERGNSGWTTVQVDGTAGTWPSLALDSSGDPHISYSVSPSQSGSTGLTLLKYAVRANGAWTETTLFQRVGSAELVESAIAVESSGQVDVLFYDADFESLALGVLPNGSSTWSTTNLAIGSFAGLSLAIDGAGGLHASYIDGISDAVLFATWRAGSWSTLTVDIASAPASYTSLAFGASPRPYLAWWEDNPTGSLRLAH